MTKVPRSIGLLLQGDRTEPKMNLINPLGQSLFFIRRIHGRSCYGVSLDQSDNTGEEYDLVPADKPEIGCVYLCHCPAVSKFEDAVNNLPSYVLFLTERTFAFWNESKREEGFCSIKLDLRNPSWKLFKVVKKCP